MESPREEPAPSEPSRTVSVVHEAPPCPDLDVEVLEEEQRQAEKPISFNLDLELERRITRNDEHFSQHGSNPELNLIGSFDMLDPPRPDGSEQRVFSCNHCQRKFYSSQALGGHQNAHKRERALAKRAQRMSRILASTSLSGFGHPYNSYNSHHNHHHHLLHRYYSGMACLPLHGSYGRSPSSLGIIQAHSSIVSSSLSNYGFGNMNGLSGSCHNRPTDQQLQGQARARTTQPLLRVGVGRFNLERAVAGSPVAAAADQAIDYRRVAAGGGQVKSSQDDQVKKLDLSLRL